MNQINHLPSYIFAKTSDNASRVAKVININEHLIVKISLVLRCI